MKKQITLSLVCGLTLNAQAASVAWPGQIVGRDMDTKLFRWLGHVGIATAPNINQVASQVIEVLKDKPVIQLNTLADFKSRSKYWGSRYGIGKNENLLQALRFGNYQRHLECADYANNTLYRPSLGFFTRTGHPVCTQTGIFRCDTFVYYLFSSIARLQIPIGNKITPKRLFLAFPYGNGDGPLAHASPQGGRMPQVQEPKVSLDKATPEMLSEMSAEEFLLTIDIPDDRLAREKAPELLALLKSPDLLSYEKKTSIVELLRMTGTSDMIPELINRYNEVAAFEGEAVQDYKNRLTSAVYILYQQDSPSKYNVLLQTYYLNLLDSGQINRKNVDQVIRGLITVMPESKLLTYEKQMNDSIDSISGLHKTMKLAMKIEMLHALPSEEKRYLSQIIALLKQENDNDLEQQFNQYVVKSMVARNMQAFTPESKALISKYLESVAHKYNTPELSADLQTDIQGLGYGMWLETSALMNSDTFIGASKYIAGFLKQFKSVDEQAQYVMGLSSSDYLKQAFSRESVLVRFKANRGSIYSQTVGDTTFGEMGY